VAPIRCSSKTMIVSRLIPAELYKRTPYKDGVFSVYFGAKLLARRSKRAAKWSKVD
jgi:hypothetical protein